MLRRSGKQIDSILLMGDERPTEWTIDAWVDPKTGKAPFEAWLTSADQYDQAIAIMVLEKVVQPLGMDICSTEWGKALGGGLYEIRIRTSLHGAETWGETDPNPAEDPNRNRTVLLRIFTDLSWLQDRVVVQRVRQGQGS
ncbi:hypothetical protein [Rhodococcus opacus]|uniref:hypothetical protein n=1 Tax=Rhodococcus opacus TaxID=37919 RepID=UPI001C442196|nr:hypothetical protein [Rhodococcus opacus]MBV6759969.1 hypothetical protein [Rhodococcus opacus]